MLNKEKSSRLTVFSWSIYDFANQPFTTIIITFVYSTYFMDYFCDSAERGAVLWGRIITISSIIVALLSPVMGALADQGGYRKIFLILWTWVCIFLHSCYIFQFQDKLLVL